MIKKNKSENDFSKFFVSEDYIKLKNKLFNYQFRKYILKKNYRKYSKIKNPKLLDVGCGISPVSPDNSKTIFIDSDKNAMTILNKLGLKTLIGNVEKIPLKNECADSIFSSEVLEHVPNYKKGLNEFNRVLKKGGLLFITVPTYMKYWDFDDEYVGHLRRFDPQNLERDLIFAGFDIIENKPIGSKIERAFTKFLVRKAMKEKKQKIGNLKMKAFSLVNKLLFCTIYFAYLLNNNKNSSISLIIGRKK